ncbi:hypothetical protein N7456_011617 [Penicillium angulare]|uniref:Uncharacterized protein n=1 Tax=Penicillium angulare TaxID=116970 RepID=A0A9W9EUC0_9EURO|nr:hypothetical protein N7456_011617 [Penicillium angulare]
MPPAAERVESGASGLENMAEGAAFAAAGLALGEEILHNRPRSQSASPRPTEKALNATPKSQSRPSSPETSRDHTQSRRMSINRSTESPTAVPLHFRRPPTSPSLQRSVPAEFPITPGSPGSPPQSRHRRPKSVEYSGEMRPMYLVEQYGASKTEPQVDEQLPSLPSSKTSSRAPSVENLRSLHDEDAVRSWEPLDPTPLDSSRRPSDLTISTERANEFEDHDLLGSQQATPTAEDFGESLELAKKQKQKPEFYTLEDLLEENPEKGRDVPPSESTEAPPSASGSVIAVKDLPEDITAAQEHERDITVQPESTHETAEEKSSENTAAELGLAGIAGAAAIAAAESREEAPESTDKELPESIEQPLVEEATDLPPSADKSLDISDAAAEIGEPGTTIEEHPAQPVEHQEPSADAESSRELAPDSSEQTVEPVQPETVEEAVVEEAKESKSQKKKKKKAKKKQASEDVDSPAEAAPNAEEQATTADTPKGDVTSTEPEAVPTTETEVPAESQPEPTAVETSRDIDVEPVPVAHTEEHVEAPAVVDEQPQPEPVPTEGSRDINVESDIVAPAQSVEAAAVAAEEQPQPISDSIPYTSTESEAQPEAEVAAPEVNEDEQDKETQGLSKKEARKAKKKNKKNKSVSSVTQDENVPADVAEKTTDETVVPPTESQPQSEETPGEVQEDAEASRSLEAPVVDESAEKEIPASDVPAQAEEDFSEFQEAREIQEPTEPVSVEATESSEPIPTVEIEEQKPTDEITEQPEDVQPTSVPAETPQEAAETDEDAFEEAVEEQPEPTEEKKDTEPEPSAESSAEPPAEPVAEAIPEAATEAIPAPDSQEAQPEEPTETQSKKSKKNKKKNRKSVVFEESEAPSEEKPSADSQPEPEQATRELDPEQPATTEPSHDESPIVEETRPSEPEETTRDIPEEVPEKIETPKEPEVVPAVDAESTPVEDVEPATTAVENEVQPIENVEAAAEPEVPLTAAQKKAAKKAAKKKAKQQSVSSIPDEDKTAESASVEPSVPTESAEPVESSEPATESAEVAPEPVVESATEPATEPIESVEPVEPTEPAVERTEQVSEPAESTQPAEESQLAEPTEPEAQSIEPDTKPVESEATQPVLTGAAETEATSTDQLQDTAVVESPPTETEQSKELSLEPDVHELEPVVDAVAEAPAEPTEPEAVQEATPTPQEKPEIEQLSEEPPPGLSKAQKRKWKEKQKKLKQQSVSSVPEDPKPTEPEPAPEAEASEASKEIEAPADEPAVDVTAESNKDIEPPVTEVQAPEETSTPATETDLAVPEQDAEVKIDAETPSADLENVEATRDIAPEEVAGPTEAAQVEEEKAEPSETQQPADDTTPALAEEVAAATEETELAKDEPVSTPAEPEQSTEPEQPKSAAEKRKEKKKNKRKSKQQEAENPIEAEAPSEQTAVEQADEKPADVDEPSIPLETEPKAETEESQEVVAVDKEISQEPSTQDVPLDTPEPASEQTADVPIESSAAESAAVADLPDETPKEPDTADEELPEQKASDDTNDVEKSVDETPTAEPSSEVPAVGEENATPTEPATLVPAEEAESTSTSSKKKNKKKKKEGQAASADQDSQTESQPQSPKVEEPPTESFLEPSEKLDESKVDEGQKEIPLSEQSSTETGEPDAQETSKELTESESQEAPVGKQEHNILLHGSILMYDAVEVTKQLDGGTTNDAPQEASAADQPTSQAEETEVEVASTKSKKNKKKNKRKSVSFEDGSDMAQPEGKAEEQRTNDSTAPADSTELTESISVEPTSTAESTEIPAESEEPKAHVEEATGQEANETSTAQSTADDASRDIAEALEPVEATQEVPEPKEKEQSLLEPSAEEMTKEPEISPSTEVQLDEQPDAASGTATPAAEPEEEEEDPEWANLSAKERKKRKKQKEKERKKKAKSLELTPEEPSAPSETPEEPEIAAEPAATEDLPAGDSQVSKPDDNQASEAQPEEIAPEQQPEAAATLNETEVAEPAQPTEPEPTSIETEDAGKEEIATPTDLEDPQAPVEKEIEPSTEEAGASEPTTEAEPDVEMTAEERRKAKKAEKKKKRKSKNVSADEPATESPADDSTTPAQESTLPDRENVDSEPASSAAGAEAVAPETASKEQIATETAPSPAEDDGKDIQSHDTQMPDLPAQTLTSTDDIVSSQVEQPQLESRSSDYPPPPVLERSNDFSDVSESAVMEEDVGAVAPVTEEPQISEEKEVGFDDDDITKENVEESTVLEETAEKETDKNVDLKEMTSQDEMAEKELTPEVPAEAPFETPVETEGETVTPVSGEAIPAEESEKSKKQKKKDKKKKKKDQEEVAEEETIAQAESPVITEGQEPVPEQSQEPEAEESVEAEPVAAIEEPPAVVVGQPEEANDTTEPDVAENLELSKEIEATEEQPASLDEPPQVELERKMSKKEKKRAKQLEALAKAQEEEQGEAVERSLDTEIPEGPAPVQEEEAAVAEPVAAGEEPAHPSDGAEQIPEALEPIGAEEQDTATSKEIEPAEVSPETPAQEPQDSTPEAPQEIAAVQPAADEAVDEFKGLSKKQQKKKRAEKAAAAAAVAVEEDKPSEPEPVVEEPVVEEPVVEEPVVEEQATAEKAPEPIEASEDVSTPAADGDSQPHPVERDLDEQVQPSFKEPVKETADQEAEIIEQPTVATEESSANHDNVVQEEISAEPDTPELSKKAKRKAKKKSKQESVDQTTPLASEDFPQATDLAIPTENPEVTRDIETFGEDEAEKAVIEPEIETTNQDESTARSRESDLRENELLSLTDLQILVEEPETQQPELFEKDESSIAVAEPETEKSATGTLGQDVPLQEMQESKDEVPSPVDGDLEATEKVPQPETNVLDPKKMSKKELRKAKKKGLILEPSPADQEQSDVAEDKGIEVATSEAVKGVEYSPAEELQASVDPQHTEIPEAEPLPIDESSAETAQPSEAVELIDKEFPVEETDLKAPTLRERNQDDEEWPTIEWDHNKSANTEPSFDQSVEVEPEVPDHVPDVIEAFDENAIPSELQEAKELEAAADQPLSKSAKKKAKKNKRKSEQATLAEPEDSAQEPSHKKIELASDSHPEPAIGAPAPKEIETEAPARTTTPGGSTIANLFPDIPRAGFRLKRSTPSLKDSAHEETTADLEANRDIAIPVSEALPNAPINTKEIVEYGAEAPLEGTKDIDLSMEQDTPPAEVLSTEESKEPELPQYDERSLEEPSTTPMHSTSKERSSTLFGSSPSTRTEEPSPSRHLLPSQMETVAEPPCGLRRTPSVVHGRHEETPRTWNLEEPTIAAVRAPSPSRSLFGGPFGDESISRPRTPLDTIAEQEPAAGSKATMAQHGTPRLEIKPEHVLPPSRSPARPVTPVRKFTDTSRDREAWPTPENEQARRSQDDLSRSRSSGDSPILKTPEQGMPVLKPSGSKGKLRRTNRSTSSDLRAASRALDDSQPPPNLDLDQLPSSSSYDPVTDKGKRPLRNMSDVYEGWGETPSSPRSPSRPPSVRRRRSMQHLQDIESRLDQLISENRLLVAARDEAEDRLRNASVARRKSDQALNTRGADLRDKEAEVEQLKNSVDWLQKEMTRLTQENEGLTASNAALTAAHAAEVGSVRESSTRELDVLRSQHADLSRQLDDRVREEIESALAQKDTELRRLRGELEAARDKVKELQQQISASVNDNALVFRDEDYFDAACQKLCGHVQQWVLRFSKHSDHRRCRALSELHDEKIADRFDNALLDGSDADSILADRVRRRDIFMSVVMTMVWEYIFTRYLFGMDREQRQKLKSLEKQLAEVGPRRSVHRWRATTLTLLSRRPAFASQRESDTEAVALEIFGTLSRVLPPPSQVEAQLLESLRKVLRVSVNLSLEMRTQLAEFIMLPPLQPEYDTNGDLARQVFFNASLMNERSGETSSNDELESEQAVVRIVLFPLVVKKGNDVGEGDDEVVVCPAQVLIARPGKDKKVSRMVSGDRMSLDHPNKSVHSIAPSTFTMDMGSNQF